MQLTLNIKLSNIRFKNQAIKQTKTQKTLNKQHESAQLKTQNQLKPKHDSKIKQLNKQKHKKL